MKEAAIKASEAIEGLTEALNRLSRPKLYKNKSKYHK